MSATINLPGTMAAIGEEFPGEANRDTRRKMIELVTQGIDVSCLCRKIAWTASGEASVLEVARVQREEDPRLRLVECDPDGNPIGAD